MESSCSAGGKLLMRDQQKMICIKVAKWKDYAGYPEISEANEPIRTNSWLMIKDFIVSPESPDLSIYKMTDK